MNKTEINNLTPMSANEIKKMELCENYEESKKHSFCRYYNSNSINKLKSNSKFLIKKNLDSAFAVENEISQFNLLNKKPTTFGLF